MVRIEAIFVGERKNITDDKGTWLSAIYRSRVQGPIELLDTGLTGDVYRTGTAIVQVSGPRMPCGKQERKLVLPGFLKRTTDSMRTGFYLRAQTLRNAGASSPHFS